MLRIINARAWAVGYERKGGGFYVRRVVWGLAHAREEQREGEMICPVMLRLVDLSQGKKEGK